MKVSNCPWSHRVGYDLAPEQDNKETPFMKASSHDLINNGYINSKLSG